MHAIQRLSLCAGLLLVLTSWAAPGAAFAKEEDPAAELLKQLTAAHKDDTHTGLPEALERVPAVHNGTQDKGLRKKLQAAVGKVLKDASAGNARSLAARVLGRLDDPEGSYKQLSGVLPKPKDKETTPAQAEALQATGALAPAGAVKALLKLLQKGKSLTAVKGAIEALGNYGNSKKRVEILKEVLDLMARHHAAAQSAAQNPKGGSGDRPWKALGPSLIETSNKLTGKSLGTAEEWLSTYKEHKKKLAALFPE